MSLLSDLKFRSAGVAVGLVLFAGILLLFLGLGHAPFDDPGEGMHAEIAREIFQTGDWFTLHLNGVRYFDKPPLLYWLTALSMREFELMEWAARLWPAFGALVALAGTAFLGARLLSFQAGCVAGLGLPTSVGFFAYARYLRPETLFVASIQWGLALLLLSRNGSRWLAILGYGALGLAGLTKDFIGALGPLVAVALALAIGRQLRQASVWLPRSGIALLLALGAAWYILAEIKNPGFLWYTVVDNHILNAFGARQFPDEDIPLTNFEFLTVAGLGAFPWVLPACLTMVKLLRHRAWRETQELPWIGLATWTVGLYSVFLLARFKLPHYGLPAYPALTLLAARWWEEDRPAKAVLMIHLVAFASMALTFALIYGSNGRLFMDSIFKMADVYTRKELAIGQVSPIPPWEALQKLAFGTALIFGAGSIGLILAIWRHGRKFGLCIVLFTLLAWMPLVGDALSLFSTARSVHSMANEVVRRSGPNDLLVHEGPIENSGALEFYSGRRPIILDGRVSVLGFGSTFTEARDMFWDRSHLKEAWHGPRHIFLLTIRDPQHSVIADLPASEVKLLAMGGGRWLYTNQP
jgi:4-amino-4-deoxy-L-arabinose transferase-like glycosyltransferase